MARDGMLQYEEEGVREILGVGSRFSCAAYLPECLGQALGYTLEPSERQDWCGGVLWMPG